MASRSYGQHCALAKSLDLVGDRWTLLVVRDLLDGPKRYGDLLGTLAPIATDMLAGRLRDLEAHGLVRKHTLPKPASTTVYELTDDGRALEDVINAYTRWGRHLIETRAPGDAVRPEWLIRAVRAFVRADRDGPPVTVCLVTPEGQATVAIGPESVDACEDAAPADVTLTGEAEVLGAAMDPAQVPGLLADGRLEIEGDPDAVARLAKAFAPPRVRG
ncbi:winged helix-turn-helix transcriptional regulator [Mycolicibacterium neworleansense]|uniref:Transcriptional regulator n=1 Tax=Mycolicibacterium neworleansense TaxID=146018 RepID=A0A0H5RW16_9MYCO|nr:winged helix-turn-helix transcriptional regulator [Mycolicibacterium neworleansense]MCV7361131.1 transcriptional regulator [Mycolicibacterium neworleansense]CRZ18118.1 transcriptional regulator [Mycolicibacterium neworleansense]